MNISKPTLLIDEQKVKKNIQKMVSKATGNNALLRPHFKTHHSAQIAEWYREAGVFQATVSSVDMAKYFAKAGWKDITIAFPYNPLEAQEVEQLAREVALSVTIVSKEALDRLNEQVKVPIGYFIKVDVGTHRTGIDPDDEGLIQALSESKNKQHLLRGLLAHVGHSYRPLTVEGAQILFSNAMEDLNKVKSCIANENLIISYGDTPSCSLLDTFPDVDELRPGNFIFYDVMQHHFGTCHLEEIAVCMACPVVAVHTVRNETVIYGGAVHFSKDFVEECGHKVYGHVVRLTENGWETQPIGYLAKLSQEHGTVILTGSKNRLNIGDLLGILPVHSCLTANLQGYYVSLDGKRISKICKTDL